uniref:Nucleoporin POM152 n=1 Tax=Gibberella zeae TaxID=5518 RepID=A0A4E9EBZ0_GIBZA
MSTSTPRLRSGFPATPAANRRHNNQQTPSSAGSPSYGKGSTTRSPSLPLAPESTRPQTTVSQPVIPLTVLDAPQQRLYTFGFYVLLWAWKLYDWLQVVEDGDSSWFLFLKWIFIDFAFLFGVPELRIPWLELSQPVVTTIFSLHLVLNYMLMFNIPVLIDIKIPWQSWILGFAKVLYDREISISEHNVKVSTILNNHSLIMGKQIINILPEGSAILNPKGTPFCLTAKPKHAIDLPIYFNATIPAEIELIRLDFETNKEETIKISNREVNRVAKQIREHNTDQTTFGFQWDYPVKKPGVYRLGKVLDEYKLEVQRVTTDTYVVPCPQARIRASSDSQRCIQELSNLSLDVYGTPPLKIQYSRTINGKDHSFHFQSLQPDGFSSPLLGASSSLVSDDQDDISWARARKVTVGLNESMTSAGEWEYSIDEVYDAFGNVVKYAELEEDPSQARVKGLKYGFKVKERPKASMNGCDMRNPFKVAKGRSVRLPVDFSLIGSKDDTSHEVTWEFSPINSLTNSGEHGDEVSIGGYNAKNAMDKPFVSEPGLYTLKTISSGSCKGEVKEPSSCLLLNPLEPSLSVRSEEIPDKCAGNSIGLRVDLDLVGTPPFVVRYDIVTSDGHVEKQSHRVPGLRSQLELVPKMAGRHKYIFKSVDDAVYENQPLTGDDKVLEQVVKPAASAKISSSSGVVNACLDSEVELDVILYGEAPFNLEWEIVHDGKRKSERVTGVQESSFRIKTNTLRKGGEYILALSSVQDKRGCKTFLQDQVKIAVRRQQPRAAFGFVEHKQKIMAVEDTHLRLPLRLEGEPPFEITYRNLAGNGEVLTKRANNANDNLLVKSQGTYELVEVRDVQCPGSVVPAAARFEVGWFPRPEISVVESPSIKSDGNTFVKQDICEGDIDGFEVNLKGSPPYHVQYDVTHKPVKGSKAFTRKDFDAPLAKAAISMDTTKAGDYTYKFSALADNLYNSDKNFHPLTLTQRVNAKPSAGFTKPGQSFKYCMEEQEHEDRIPIKLTGEAPFYVEVEIKHQAGSPAETYRIPSIDSNSYGIRIPRQHLRLGAQQVRIRTVRDARGCQRKYEHGGPSVQIHLYEAPSIYPLESRRDYCVGERIAYTLSGTPPFDISYDFNGRWNAKSQTTSFRRIAEKPGDFTITSISDKASECRAAVNIPKTIHPLPSVQISRGKQSRVDIHEGNEVDIFFEFWGTPPFEFTYTRSSNAKKGQRSVVLETRHDVSYEHSKVVKASQEGTYEVVAIKDKFCSFSTQQVEKKQRR